MFHILDDETELLEILQEMIEDAGYKVKQFNSAEAYLDYFNSPDFFAPIAIITDYQMSGLTGLSLIKKVHEKIPHQKAIIISGTPSPVLERAIHNHLCFFSPKPNHFTVVPSLLESLSRCEHDYQVGDVKRLPDCKYGLNHKCPNYHP